jgi:hypothetical protein
LYYDDSAALQGLVTGQPCCRLACEVVERFKVGKMRTKLLFFLAFLALSFVGSGCNPSAEKVASSTALAEITTPILTVTSPTAPAEAATPILMVTPLPTATPEITPDLNQKPLVWFNPLPPMRIFPSRPFIGSSDFMDLFNSDAEWAITANNIQVFELYGEWLGNDATDRQLRQLVSDLNRRGMAIALSGGALNPVENCSGAIEGFAGTSEGVHISQRIRDAGGIAYFYAFDHAYDAGTASTTPAECRLSPEEVAQQVLTFQEAIREIFPNIIFGDDITAQLNVDEIARWVEAYRSVTGEDLGFLHLDIDFSIPNWEQKALQIENYLHSKGIAFGLFYIGNWEDPSDEAWLTSAGERVKAYELDAGGQPDHVIFASWHDHPDYVLPETESYTFTNFIKQYIDDRESLGVQTEGAGANLAYGKPVTASKALAGLPPHQAVDGIFSTWWGAGDFAPQWIEVDLGAAYTIAQIRLSISQDPEGNTLHQVWGRGPGEEARLLHEFDGMTRGDQVLEYTPPDPWHGIQFIRIVTVSSPSWVSWREIEVIAAK